MRNRILANARNHRRLMRIDERVAGGDRHRHLHRRRIQHDADVARDGGPDLDRLDMRAEARRLNAQAVDAVRQPRDHGAAAGIGGDALVQLIRFARELECRGDSQSGGVVHHHAELAGRALGRQHRGGQREENQHAEADPDGRVI